MADYRFKTKKNTTGFMGTGVENYGTHDWTPYTPPPELLAQWGLDGSRTPGPFGMDMEQVPNVPAIDTGRNTKMRIDYIRRADGAMPQITVPLPQTLSAPSRTRSSNSPQRSVSSPAIPANPIDAIQTIRGGQQGMGNFAPDAGMMGRYQAALDRQQAPGNHSRNDADRISGLIDDIRSEMRSNTGFFLKGGARKAATARYVALAGLLGSMTGAYGELAGDTAGLSQMQHKDLMENTRGYNQQGITDNYYRGINANNAEQNRINLEELLRVKIPESRAEIGYKKAASKAALRGGAAQMDPYAKARSEVYQKALALYPEGGMDAVGDAVSGYDPYMGGAQYQKGQPEKDNGMFYKNTPATDGYWIQRQQKAKEAQAYKEYVRMYGDSEATMRKFRDDMNRQRTGR